MRTESILKVLPLLLAESYKQYKGSLCIRIM